MAFIITDGVARFQPIADTDTVQNHKLGTIVRAFDDTYGSGEFIYLKGVASTVVGSAVVWDSAFQTVLTLATTTGSVGISMSINVASQYGWYQIQGLGRVISAGAVTSGLNLNAVTASPGKLDDTATAGADVQGAVAKSAAGAGDTLFTVSLSYPCMNGTLV